MKLSTKARFGFQADSVLALVECQDESGRFALRNLRETGPRSLHLGIGKAALRQNANDVFVSAEWEFVREGDIVRLNPRSGDARVLYRRNSRHNFLFVTERCNSRCLMCSQPPRDVNDGYLVEDILQMIPSMANETAELGITGGEPTLLHGKLLEIIASTKQHLPTTALHMLSNGRLFSYLRYAQRLAEIGHPDFMVGIPLYADTAAAHDFVVQAKGAFAQTIFGLLNLGRAGVRIELRMVVHRQTFARLPQFARFVARNIPFVDQVVIMGLELTGFTRSNLEALWIEPDEYQAQLEQCVTLLDDAGIKVHIYNHQLCLLRPSLRRFATKSISDWKNVYLPECEQCIVKKDCGGLFASARLRPPTRLRPILKSDKESGSRGRALAAEDLGAGVGRADAK